jgi:hypothetical protein
LVAVKTTKDKLTAKHKAELDAVYAKHLGEIKDMSRTGYE